MTEIRVQTISMTEVAMALGVRDRIMGVDADTRRETLALFGGCQDLENAFHSGWVEAEGYIANVANYAAEHARRAMVAA